MSVTSLLHKKCLKNLERIWKDGNCPVESASKLIEASAWFNHPTAGWVRAPKHANRLRFYNEKKEVGVKFSSHVFYVSRAAEYAFLTLEAAIEEISGDPSGNGLIKSWEKLYETLFEGTTLAVGALDGTYYGYGTLGFKHQEGMLVFGNQGIFIPNFVGTILNIVEFHPLIPEAS